MDWQCRPALILPDAQDIAEPLNLTSMKLTLLTPLLVAATTLLFCIITTAPIAAATPIPEAAGLPGDRHLSTLSKRQCIYQRAFYDDNVAFKEPGTYFGAWTHMTNQGSTVKEGTLSYTGQPNA